MAGVELALPYTEKNRDLCLPVSTKRKSNNNAGGSKEKTYKLQIHKLSYKVSIRKKNGEVSEKVLLNKINAVARPGEILAVMGPSGAGKSTFLDAVAGQIEPSSLKGHVLVNGKLIDSSIKRVSGYVMQDDNLFPNLSVRETLMFSARLRLPRTMSQAEKIERVTMLINELGLQECANTYIGNNEIRGVSGGERRRVSIGVDLIHDPAILLLDEPTSGLDSTAALKVVEILYKMAEHRKRTIVLTIHQPSFRILEKIHNILILAHGNSIFHGAQTRLVPFFREFGRQIPEHVNSVEFVLDLIEEQQGNEEGLAPLIAFAESKAKNGQAIKLEPKSFKTSDIIERSYANNIFSEFLILIDRNFKNIFRTRELFVTRFILLIISSLCGGSIFWDAEENTVGIRSRQSYFAFTLGLIIFSSTESLPVLLDERQIFRRESSCGSYRTSTYVVANAIVFLPFLLWLAVFFPCVSYFMVDLSFKLDAFVVFICAIFLTYCISNSFVSLIATLVPDFIVGNTVANSINAYFFLFSGFFIPRVNIPRYWIWMHYLSSLKYPLEILEHNEYSHLQNSCWSKNLDGSCGQDTKKVLESLSAGSVNMVENFSVMVFFLVGYRVLQYIVLRFQKGSIRK